MTRASILVPTHDHASTLPLAVRSALASTVTDLEVIIVGDGVTDEVRAIARDLERADARVRFLDFPKGPHHGEIHRHTAIEASRGDAILYLCDDDLLLPDHVADLCGLLATADLVQSRNGHLDPAGRVGLYPGDLADPRCVAMMLDESRALNFVSLTGTGHTRRFYDAADRPWTTTPAGIPPDLHQWRRMLRARPARGATSPRMTALQFPTHLDGRSSWSAEERLAELRQWADDAARPGIQARVDALVDAATREMLIDALLRVSAVEGELVAHRRTLSWRLTAPLRSLRRLAGAVRR